VYRQKSDFRLLSSAHSLAIQFNIHRLLVIVDGLALGGSESYQTLLKKQVFFLRTTWVPSTEKEERQNNFQIKMGFIAAEN
jgi:hypothetical protein